MKWLTTRGECGHVGTRLLKLRDVRRCVDDLLQVVEEEQQPLRTKFTRVLRTDRRRNGRQYELRVAKRRKPDPPDAVAEVVGQLGRDVERKARLADSAWPCDRHQTRTLAKEPQHVGKLLLPADQRFCGQGKVAVVEALQRREVAEAELIDPLRRG